MPKSVKNKTQKILHPYSRKAKREDRKQMHKQRLQNVRSERSTKLDILAEKLQWFHDQLDDRPAYTKADLLEMLDLFRHRFDEELEQIAIVHSVGVRKTTKQHVSRQSAIQFTMDMEKNEFESIGIEVPDLVNKDNLYNFRLWNGEMKYVQNFKMKKIGVRDQEKLLAQATLSTAEEKEGPEEATDAPSATEGNTDRLTSDGDVMAFHS